MSTGYIYGLVDPTTGLIRYVGMTTRSLDERLANHLYAAGNNASPRRPRVLRWILSLAPQCPEIILIESLTYANPSDLGEREKFWIAYYREQRARLCNHTDGGDGVLGLKWSEESKRALRARVVSVETRKKISEAAKRRFESQEERNTLSATRLGKPMSKEARAAMSAAQRARMATDEGKQQIDAARASRWAKPGASDRHRAALAAARERKKTQ